MRKKNQLHNPLQIALQQISELTVEDINQIEQAILEHRLDILNYLLEVKKTNISH